MFSSFSKSFSFGRRSVGETVSYLITTSSDVVQEGEQLTVTLTTVGVPNGTNIPFTITGVTSEDIDGFPLTGNFFILSNTASFVVTITQDFNTESETFTISLDGLSVSKSVTLEDLWLPSNVSPAAWFDASDESNYSVTGSEVTEVIDKVGNFTMSMPGEKPTENTGGLNGLNVWDFTGGAYIISENSGPYCSSGNHWAVGVFKWDIVNNDRDSFWSAAGTRTYAVSSSNSSNSWPGEIDYDNSNEIVTGVGRNLFFNSIGGSTWVIVSIIFNKTGNQIFGQINGTRSTGIDAYNASMDTNCDDLRMMRNRGTRKLDGSMAEYFHVADIPGTGGTDISDVQKAEGYLAHKWGLTGSLPSGHPYKNIAPK